MFKRAVAKCGGVLFYMAQYGCVAYCTLEYVADFVVCSGPSMQPTINTSDIVLTEHISVFKRRIQRGDVVISKAPMRPEQFICKRVVAMEGDRVFNTATQAFQTIPRGHVWLEGDNKENSSDSREYGPVPYGLLRGRAFFKIWPLYSLGPLRLADEAKTPPVF